MFSRSHASSLLICMLISLVCGQCLAGSILWDTSHGVYLNYDPSGDYLPLVQDIGGIGITVDTTSAGFLVDDPGNYDAIVVSVGSSWDSVYSTGEAAAIRQFVFNGGGLLIIGENTDCPNPNIQPVASEFGVSLGVSYLANKDVYTSDLGSHPIFDGVDQIYMRAVGEISSAGGLAEVALEAGSGKALVTAGSYGSGRIVVLGDSGIFSNFLHLADNHQFAMNTFTYLVPEPATILLLGLGGLALTRRRA